MHVPYTFRFSAVALWASSHALDSETGPGWTGHVVTPTPIYTPTNPAAPSCTNEGASVFFFRPVANEQLQTALREASITTTGPPSLPCSVLAALPTSVHGAFASLETTWSDWWQTARTNYSSWASTCTGEYTGAVSDFTEGLNMTSSMDNFTPSATDCPGFVDAAATTGSGAGTGTPPAETSPSDDGAGRREAAGLGGVAVAAVACIGLLAS